MYGVGDERGWVSTVGETHSAVLHLGDGGGGVYTGW